MKFIFLILFCALMVTCSNPPAATVIKTDPVDTMNQVFFPVTSFIGGQLFEFKQRGMSPLKYIRAGGHNDSLFLKPEEIEKEAKPFLTPLIDTTNLSGLFTESKFFDQTLNLITYSYSPKKALPDSMELSRWDVYVDPEISRVKRIYMEKLLPDHTRQLLTWVSGKWFSIVRVETGKDGQTSITREEKITWEY